jgi:F0F1-type ATP synthase assembly protein I
MANADDEKKELYKQLAGAGESVLATAILAGLGVWGGMAVDGKFHISPWGTVCLSMLGVGLGLARMVMKALQSEKK